MHKLTSICMLMRSSIHLQKLCMCITVKSPWEIGDSEPLGNRSPLPNPFFRGFYLESAKQQAARVYLKNELIYSN